MVQNASREPIVGRAALDVLEGVTDLYVAKGSKTVHIDLAGARPSDDELLALLLGRSGNLRAPALRVGPTLIVGYNGEILAEHLTPTS